MSNVATPEALALRWTEVMHDPGLRDLPYKIELNAWGKIEMSPGSSPHARLRGRIAAEFSRQLPAGEVLTEVAILTDIGVRVPDVAWASGEFFRMHGETTPYPHAPELCVEIVSAWNADAELQEKTRAYLAAGAQEVWLVPESGAVRYFDATGEQDGSRYSVTLELPPRTARAASWPLLRGYETRILVDLRQSHARAHVAAFDLDPLAGVERRF
jgi:Uma2 family endonuclease